MREMNMIIEICANSFESAKAAQDGGANRIELCTDLSNGGLTPSHDLIEVVLEKLNIPVHVLIRPRSGDFVYSEKEMEICINMASDRNVSVHTYSEKMANGLYKKLPTYLKLAEKILQQIKNKLN